MRVKEPRPKRIATEISTPLLAAKASATDKLITDLGAPPADGLDMIIGSLNKVIPVFNDRQLHLGTNTRYISGIAGFVSKIAQDTALATQNARRKQIIPASPKFLILKEAALKAAGEIDSLVRQELASEKVDAHGRRFLAGIAQRDIRALVNAITHLESHWGSIQIWVKQPKRTLCQSMVRAWQNGEADSEEFLVWFREHELGLLGRDLDPNIAEVLLGLHSSGGEIELPGDLQSLAHLNEHEIYNAVLHKARFRKLAEQDGRRDRVRLTVGHDTGGKKIRRYAQSLDAEDKDGLTLKDRLPDITRDPIEFLFSSRQFIKLEDLAGMRDELAADDRWSRLNLTLDEYRYVRLHYGFGMTQNEACESLNWGPVRTQSVRRNADLKLKKYRNTVAAEDKLKN